jgi:hypothetical protein
MKFLGIKIDNTLSWKSHKDVIVRKLCAAYFVIRMFKAFTSLGILKIIYYAYFHSITNYGIILGGNSSYSNTTFKLQKRIITINLGVRARDSCREYFRELNILPLQSQYIYTLAIVQFVIINKNEFAANSDIQSTNIRNKSHFHQPLSILTSYQKESYYFGITVFSCLPEHKRNYNMKQFKSALKGLLNLHSFYSLGEYFNSNKG